MMTIESQEEMFRKAHITLIEYTLIRMHILEWKIEFQEILNFIRNELIPNYNELVSCELFYEDELSPQYYLRFRGDLSTDERNRLHLEILDEINFHCILSDHPRTFKHITLLLVREPPKEPEYLKLFKIVPSQK